MNSPRKNTESSSKRARIFSICLTAALAIAGAALATRHAPEAHAQADSPAIEQAQRISSAFKEVARTVRPSVVNIEATKKVRLTSGGGPSPFPGQLRDFLGDGFDRFLRQPDQSREQRGVGSGVIVSEEGYIITNAHVVKGANEIVVTTYDDQKFNAEVVGMDERSDIAVLKIPENGYQAAKLGDSDAMEVGDWVVAVGSPLGLRESVTAGIVSAVGRNQVGIAEFENFIQTDAAINPGNSGGPLTNLRGEVIGINTAIATHTGGWMGISFAIPSNMTRSIMESIIEDGHVVRGWLGVVISDLTPELAESFGHDGTNGALIQQVQPGSPADEAGLEEGDIILSFDGEPIDNIAHLKSTVAATKPGSRIAADVIREGDNETLRVKIGELGVGDDTRRELAGRDTGEEGLGLTVRPMTAEEALASEVDQDEGVIVTGIEPGGPAARAGIRRGDVIRRVGGKLIRNLGDFRATITEADLEKGVRLQIVSQGQRRFVFVREK